MFLTKRQTQMLDYLRRTIALQGYAPSLEEMAAHFDLSSVGTVHKHLKALEEKGFIRRQWNRSRAIEIVEISDGRARRLPLLGALHDGRPIELPTSSASVAVPEEFLRGPGRGFVLQVSGESLHDEFLDDGDFVVCESVDEPEEGATVVVLVDHLNAVVRRWHRGEDRVVLRSPRPGVPPIDLAPNRCRVEGVVVGVIRRLRATV